MEIWSEEGGASSFLLKECKDCSRGATSPDPQIDLPLLIDQSLLQGRQFVKAPLLYVSECAPGRWIVCYPTGKGRVAVVDQEALDLLEAFRSPISLSQIIEQQTQWSFATLVRLFEQFLRLGLISFADTPSRPVFPDETTTLSAWLHISNACNLACSYCYISKTTEHMQEDIAYRSVDAIFRSAVRRNVRSLLLKYAGGEASLLMPRVCALHDYAAKLAHEYGIQLQAFMLSNGVMLTQRTIEALKTRQIGLMISLDGLEADHDSQRPFANGMGSFRYVERTLQRLRENDLTPHVSVTISQRNLAGVPRLLEYLLERDLPFSLNYYRENACSSHLHDLQFAEREMIETMRGVFALLERRLPRRNLLSALLDKADLENPHEHTCGAGHNYLVIDQRGGIAKCHADLRSTITTIDDDDPLLTIQEDCTGLQNRAVDEKEGCRSCQWRYWCTGGCPLLTWKITGRSDRRSPNCAIYQALFPEVLRLEALRLLTYKTPLSCSVQEDARADEISLHTPGRARGQDC